MKDQNEELDEMIKKALSREEQEYYDNLQEQTPFEMIGELFKGKQKWFTLGNGVVSLAFIGLAIYSLIQILNIEETNQLIRWSLVLVASMMTTSMLKLWNWLQMNKNALTREIKKLQLLLAHKN